MQFKLTAPPPPGAPVQPASAQTPYSAFLTAYERALSGKTIGDSHAVSNAVAHLTESAFNKFLTILNASGMSNATTAEMLDLLAYLALGVLKAKSKLPLASPLHVTGHMVRGYVSREVKATSKTADATSDRRSRPSSGSDYLRPHEEDQLRETQGDYDFAFNTTGQSYAVAIIRALKLVQSLPEKVSITEVRGRMIHTWYKRPEGVSDYWMAWLWLSGFNYTAVSNWLPDIPPPSFVNDVAQRDAITAVCSKLIRYGDWLPGSVERCRRFLESTIEIAGHTPSPLHANVDDFRKCSGDIAEIDKRAFLFADEIRKIIERKMIARIPTPSADVFEALKLDHYQLGAFDIPAIEGRQDNMSSLMRLSGIPKFFLLRTLLGEVRLNAVDKRLEEGFDE